jgi:SAM-dependent methyltransferase
VFNPEETVSASGAGIICNQEDFEMPAGDYYSNETCRFRPASDAFLHRERVCLNYLQTHMPPDGTFVDLGCGTGWFMFTVQTAFSSVKMVGLEYSIDQIAHKVSPDLVMNQADFSKPLPLEDNSADAVYCGEIIEHLVDPDFFIREIHRILKRNGVVIVTTPNLCAWHSRILMLCGIQPICYEASSEDARVGFGPLKKIKRDSLPVGHLRLFSLRALTEIFQRYQFDIDTVRGTEFDYFHGSIRLLDRMLSVLPGIASGLMVAARKR